MVALVGTVPEFYIHSGYLTREDSSELVASHVLSGLRVSGHDKILHWALITVLDGVNQLQYSIYIVRCRVNQQLIVR